MRASSSGSAAVFGVRPFVMSEVKPTMDATCDCSRKRYGFLHVKRQVPARVHKETVAASLSPKRSTG